MKEIEVQSEQLSVLTTTIKDKEREFNTRSKEVKELRNINTFEQEKLLKYQKANAALKAKLAFIEQKYDYSSQAKNLSINDFKEVISSNLNMNDSLGGFAEKLQLIQKEI